MSKRYASVDRSKEIKAKKEINPSFFGRKLILDMEEFDINNLFTATKKSTLKTLNPIKINPKKLPLISNYATKSHLCDINTKTTNISTEVNNILYLEHNINDKNTNIKTETNNDNNNDNCYNIIINSNFDDKNVVKNNNTQSLVINKAIKPKLNININYANEIKNRNNNNKIKYPPILKSERLYPRINNDKNKMNILKKVKAIRNNNLRIKNCKNFIKNKLINENIAYNSKYEDIVFDSKKILNNHNSKETDIEVKNNIDSFIKQNKELSVNNLLIQIIKKENKNVKENFEKRNKSIEEFQKIIEKDENDFEIYSSKQKNLYYKINDLSEKIHKRNYNLITLLYKLRAKTKILEDEIFKIIELIESLRIYAKFVHKVLGGNDKLFDEELIPDYENNTRPDIKILVNRVFEIYGNLLKNNHKQSMTANTCYTINNEEKNTNNNERKPSEEVTIEDIDFELLDDPLFMVRKYKDIEERILNQVEVQDNYNKFEEKESNSNKKFIDELKNRIIQLEKENEMAKKNLNEYKNMLYGKTLSQNENKENYSIVKDLCGNIFQVFNPKDTNGIINNNNLDIFELNDVVSSTINLLIKKENEINQHINNLESYEKDKILFDEIMDKRKNEIKFLNQNKNMNNLNNNDFNKMYKIHNKLNKIIIKSKRSEPPYYKIRKKEVVKIDVNEIVNKENNELLLYK